MKINIKKIILWILFWYYLIPYYLLKKFVFRGKHGKGLSIMGAIVIVFIGFCTLMGNDSGDNDTSNQSIQTKTHYVVKKVGTKELAKQKQQKIVLLKEKKKKQAEYKKLKEQLSNYQEKEAAEKKKAAAAAKSTKAEEKAKSSSSKSSHNDSTRSSNTSNSNDDNSDDGDTSGTGGTKGDMNTADTGKIVGNSRSKIYHVPGQAGYRMNSSNAVYFNSEQEAIAAGYRKAKR